MSEQTLRLDKWLWFARFFKTRPAAGAAIAAGGLRLNGRPVVKAHQGVRAGDVLTCPIGAGVRVVRVIALGTRRGPAPEAQLLYEEID